MYRLAGSLWILSTVMVLPLVSASGAGNPIQIGIAKSFFHDRPKSIVKIATDEFKAVMKKATGMEGEPSSKDGPAELAEKLRNKQLDLGIFHAHEFAWLQKKYPDLKPFLITANKDYVERAYLIVHKNSPAKSFADLRGKKLDLPAGTKEHCRVFVAKHCTDKDPKATFFSSIGKSPTQVEALDSIALDKAQATVVDTLGLQFYKEVKGPVFAKHLKVLQQSEEFPPAVLVYNPGTLDPATLDGFRDGLLKVHLTDLGRDMMKTWNIQAFEPIPKDYAKSLAELLKAYPPPESLR